MDLASLKTLGETIYYFVAAGAAISAVLVFYWNSSLERAKWASSLYDKFDDSDRLKVVRDVLDDPPNCETVRELVASETSNFTDYLNFFEFIGLLVQSRQVSHEQVEVLFGYYLDCLNRHRVVRIYVENASKGFEELNAMLIRRRP